MLAASHLNKEGDETAHQLSVPSPRFAVEVGGAVRRRRGQALPHLGPVLDVNRGERPHPNLTEGETIDDGGSAAEKLKLHHSEDVAVAVVANAVSDTVVPVACGLRSSGTATAHRIQTLPSAAPANITHPSSQA